MRGQAAGGQLAAALAHVDEPHDRVHQVRVGRQLQRIDAAARERLAQVRFALRRDAGEAPAKASVVRVDDELLAGFRVAQREQPEVRQLQLQRIEHAHRHHFVPLRKLRQRLFPARFADEIGHHENRGPSLDQARAGGQ